jgi:hypothetical protein
LRGVNVRGIVSGERDFRSPGTASGDLMEKRRVAHFEFSLRRANCKVSSDIIGFLFAFCASIRLGLGLMLSASIKDNGWILAENDPIIKGGAVFSQSAYANYRTKDGRSVGMVTDSEALVSRFDSEEDLDVAAGPFIDLHSLSRPGGRRGAASGDPRSSPPTTAPASIGCMSVNTPKLRLWTLDQIGIKSAVYLDGDTLVKRNFDELPALPFEFAASPDVYLDAGVSLSRPMRVSWLSRRAQKSSMI